MMRPFLLPFLFLTLPLLGQDKSAAGHDGLVIPLLTDAEMLTLDRPGQGALVYNQSAHGFWFFDGHAWRPLLSAEFSGTGEGIHWRQQRPGGQGAEEHGAPRLSSGTSGFWDLTGNVATDAAINFLGTTDAEDLVFRTNNVERMRIDDLSARVGIGTASFTDLLTVEGTNTATVQGITMRKVDNSPVANALRLEHARGIPSARTPLLDGDELGEIRFSGFDGTNMQAGAMIVSEAAQNFGSGAFGSELSFWTSANSSAVTTKRMVIDPSGNVGIGPGVVVGTLTERLHVVGNIRMEDGAQAAGRVMVSDANGRASWSNVPAWGLTGSAGTNPATHFVGTTDAQSLAVRTGNLERMRIESTGDVGIGTTNPQKLLHLFQGNSAAAINSNAVLVVEDDANAYVNIVTPEASESGLLFGTPSHSAEGAITYNQTATPNGLSFRTNGNISRAVIDQNGLLGVGNAAPLTRVDISGGLAVRRPGTIVLATGANTVTVGDNSYLRIQGAASATVNLSNGLSTGQLLYIEGLTASFTINDNAGVSNCNLVANRTIGDDDSLSLIWNGTDWIELAFANN